MNCQYILTRLQHTSSNHQNLFDNIKVKLNEENFNLFKHGGAGYWKPTHGMFNTFWNVELDFHFSNPNKSYNAS